LLDSRTEEYYETQKKEQLWMERLSKGTRNFNGYGPRTFNKSIYRKELVQDGMDPQKLQKGFS